MRLGGGETGGSGVRRRDGVGWGAGWNRMGRGKVGWCGRRWLVRVGVARWSGVEVIRPDLLSEDQRPAMR